MIFSSISFIFFFLPLVLTVYFLAPAKLKNLVLLGASLLFYFYGEPVYSVLMVVSSLTGYLHGIWINKCKNGSSGKLALISSVVCGLFFLLIFKYADFIIANINLIPGIDLPLPGLRLPIGISFYTFQILSYTLDVYYGKAGVQRSPVKILTYTALFPQLIAGPIVRYNTIESQLADRSISWNDLAYGINRFVLGLAKKVIIANTLGEMGQRLGQMQQKPVLYFWLTGIAFMLQIYFDFSAYSDMAIGLGRLFGFRFLENFNYPFISQSITEFWRRWHISLGTWFRDYVYIPLGGNRVGKGKWIRNIFVVWALTGLWHGAKWNFVIWGLYFALVLVAEKLFLHRILGRLPAILRHAYTMFVALISFVIFNAAGLPEVGRNLAGMFGLLKVPFLNGEVVYYLRSYLLVIVIAVAGSTPVVSELSRKFLATGRIKAAAYVLQPAWHMFLLLICTAFLIDGSFNPFLYFRF